MALTEKGATQSLAFWIGDGISGNINRYHSEIDAVIPYTYIGELVGDNDLDTEVVAHETQMVINKLEAVSTKYASALFPTAKDMHTIMQSEATKLKELCDSLGIDPNLPKTEPDVDKNADLGSHSSSEALT